MKKLFVMVVAVFTMQSAFANVECRTSDENRRRPNQFVQSCILGRHAVELKANAKASAFIDTCRFQTKYSGEYFEVKAVDENFSEIILTLNGRNPEPIQKNPDGKTYSFLTSMTLINDIDSIECETVPSSQVKKLKYSE